MADPRFNSLSDAQMSFLETVVNAVTIPDASESLELSRRTLERRMGKFRDAVGVSTNNELLAAAREEFRTF